jgi:hypothetical protein
MKGSGVLAPMVNRQSSGPFVERSDKVGTYQVERIIRVGCRVSGDNTEGAARQAELIELDVWVVLKAFEAQLSDDQSRSETLPAKDELSKSVRPCGASGLSSMRSTNI